MKNINPEGSNFKLDIAAIGLFLLISVIYCFPMLQGKDVVQHDVMSWRGMSQETVEFNKTADHYTGWTGSMFAGMPTLQIAGQTPVDDVKAPLVSLTRLGTPGLIAIIFNYLLCFFLMFRAFKVNTWMSVLGALITAFSSYFIVIIDAGHITKAFAIGYMALVFAGSEWIFRKKYIWGLFLIALGFGFATPLHPQMVYYFMMLFGLYAIARFIMLKKESLKPLLIAGSLIVAGLAIGFGMNARYFFTNQEYLKETMRGGHSELDAKTSEKGGLDLDYATQWSYGIDETLTLLIPNFKGGGSNTDVGAKSEFAKTLIAQGVPEREAAQYAQNVPTYWGTQPFTSGPVYVGALAIFLFVVALYTTKGPLKWALVAATAFSILLSWGRNFMPLTEFFMDFFPGYNKFRAVSSILVVAEVSIPLLAILGLKELIDPKVDTTKRKKIILNAFYIVGGLTLFFALFGSSLYSFVSANDEQFKAQVPAWFYDAIVSQRASMLRMDAIRSLVFIALGFGALYLYNKGKMKQTVLYITLIAIAAFDIVGVATRYFSHDNFVPKKEMNKTFIPSQADQLILQDPDPHYRVLNTTTNTFNDAMTSYFHKSVGGYHAAKLRRYQDMIERHIGRGNVKVINMLNTKYFIVKGADGTPDVQRNVSALGNAWFINNVQFSTSPNEEISALDSIDPATVAVVDTQFTRFVESYLPADSTSLIRLESYAPDKLVYRSTTAIENQIAVFSEVYYPYGWKAYIDGQLVEHFRVNYILRALNVPKGDHEIVFVYDSDTAKRWNGISMTAVFLVYALLLGAIIVEVFSYRKRKQAK